MSIKAKAQGTHIINYRKKKLMEEFPTSFEEVDTYFDNIHSVQDLKHILKCLTKMLLIHNEAHNV